MLAWPAMFWVWTSCSSTRRGTAGGALAPVLKRAFTDGDSLAALAARCEVVTIDWENVSVADLRCSQAHARVSPLGGHRRGAGPGK